MIIIGEGFHTSKSSQNNSTLPLKFLACIDHGQYIHPQYLHIPLNISDHGLWLVVHLFIVPTCTQLWHIRPWTMASSTPSQYLHIALAYQTMDYGQQYTYSQYLHIALAYQTMDYGQQYTYSQYLHIAMDISDHGLWLAVHPSTVPIHIRPWTMVGSSTHLSLLCS